MSEAFNDEPGFNEFEPSSADIVEILRVFGPDYGFDEQTCDEIADMTFDEAFEAVYGLLTQAGLDADEELSSFFA